MFPDRHGTHYTHEARRLPSSTTIRVRRCSTWRLL
jgi:hypothetical protein